MRIMSFLGAVKILAALRYASVIGPRVAVRLLSSEVEKQEPIWANMNVEELGASRQNLQLIDVREPNELEYHGCFKGAINVPLGEVEEAFKLDAEEFKQKYGYPQPSKSDDNIVFHCLRGVRSHTALTAAHQLGYSKARHLEGGWKAWIKHILENELKE